MNKKLCVIVPFRKRDEHLKIFIPKMEDFLSSFDFTIVVVEQFDDKLFNRAKLLNIGFDYCKNNCDYVCFHDVDMIPINADYSYPNEPIHMATNASQFGGRLPYEGYYGGVNLFNIKDFVATNGYSNNFWGWGGEDDDLLNRVLKTGYRLTRRTGYYKSLEHISGSIKNKHDSYSDNLKKLETEYDYFSDGINTLKYEIINEQQISNKTKLIKVI
jgi:predicted glycosyltransferase involved in capsule biosynthesis